MGEVEVSECSFCHQVKPVERTYIYPSKYIIPEKNSDKVGLYNEGMYFVIVWSCNECGVPEI